MREGLAFYFSFPTHSDTALLLIFPRVFLFTPDGWRCDSRVNVTSGIAWSS